MQRFKQGVGDDATAVMDRPQVVEAKTGLDAERERFKKAKDYLDKIENTLAPSLTTATSPVECADEIAMIRARAALPQAQQMYWEAEVTLKAAERSFQQAVEAGAKSVTLARQEPRRVLVRELFDRLDEAKTVAEEVAAYDEETTRLGGKAPAHPFSELLGDSCKPSMVDFRREYFLRDGTL